MPKNKKPAGGRPAQNFDPRDAKKSATGPFRGRDDDRSGSARKPRWTGEDRAGRAASRDDRGQRFDRDARAPRRDDRSFGDRGPRR